MITQKQKEQDSDKTLQDRQRINEVLDYIHHNLCKPLSIAELTKQSGWSRWQLQRVFQRETGSSLATYVRELRLAHADTRLTNSSERVIDIAIELGFGSEISFSRTFKQKFGTSPSTYRKQHAKELIVS